ncbi:MAG: hypothetical protein HY423_15245 [Candidatus Lambdaproteobacteria bacterium]|nr:hypothetical protein [Candidatus Lambdaproteobacteria bacterium]
MPPGAQELDAYFQAAPVPPSQELTPPDDKERREFEEFFRRLSTIDDLSWSDAPTAAHPAAPATTPATTPTAPAAAAAARPEAGHAAPSPAKAAPGATAAAARGAGRIRIPANERRATEFEPASPNASPSPFGDMKPLANRNHPGLWVTAAKMTGVGVLLFAMGLAGGWLVLSLPKRLERHQASRPAIAHEPAGAARASAPKLTPHAALPAAPPVAPVAPPPVAPADLAAPSGAGLPADAALASTAPAAERPEGAETHAEEAPPQPAVETVTLAPPARKAAPAGGRAPGPRPTAAPKVATPLPGSPRYALQVGACGSAACVARYRTLLAGHVGAGTIQVASRPQAGGGDLQRIRIAPLDREAALKLKERLAAADARFGRAYLVAL